MRILIFFILSLVSFSLSAQTYEFVIENGIYVKKKIESPEQEMSKAEGMAAGVMAQQGRWEAYDAEKADFLSYGLTGPEADKYIANIDVILGRVMAKKMALMAEVDAIVSPVSVNTDGTSCNDIENGEKITLWGDYTISDGDCDSRNDTNGDMLIFKGTLPSISNDVGVTLSNDTLYINSSGWSFDIKGGFVVSKIGGQFADFKIEEK